MEGAKHPFICNLHFAFQSEDKLYMITDYCPGGELFFHLKKLHSFSETMVRFYSAEIILGLSHLHSQQVRCDACLTKSESVYQPIMSQLL